MPVAELADTCVELTVLFDKYAYADSVIFGHAKDGNIHFMLTDRFEGESQTGPLHRLHRGDGRPGARPRRLAEGRARHRPGDGAVRPAAVRRRAVRRDVRDQAAVRPDRAAQRRARSSPTTPSCTSSTSSSPRASRPRSTAASSAATASRSARPATSPSRRGSGSPCGARSRTLELAGDTRCRRANWRRTTTTQVVHTCAVDGMCGTACPVLINTGLLVKKLRRDHHSQADGCGLDDAGQALEGHDGHLLHGDEHHRRPARAAGGRPDRRRQGGPRRARQRLRPAVVGRAARRWCTAPPSTPGRRADAVYLPACVNVMFGPAEGVGVQLSFEALCAKPG